MSDQALLWPQARAFWDRERVSLVSVEAPRGWYHGLWFPGYLWADTEGRWRVPGLDYHDGMDDYDLDHPALDAAMARLQQDESAAGHWSLATPNYPGYRRIMESFPLGGRFADTDGQWAVSQQPPAAVAAAFQGVF